MGPRPTRPLAATLAVALAATASCSHYIPRASPYIVRDSADVFHRDGVEHPVGLLGGGADDLVAGNAPAVAFARRHQRLVREGTAFYVLGLTTMVIGALAASSSASSSSSWSSRREALFWGSFAGGLAVTTLGVSFMLDGKAALVDAINVYNDGVEAASARGAP